MLPSQMVPSLAPRQHLRIKIDHPAILFSLPAVPTEGEPSQEEQQMEQEQRGGKEGWGTGWGKEEPCQGSALKSIPAQMPTEV